jgi:hypothetical protein
MNVRDSYDSAAEAYAQHLASELTHKPLDRHLLWRPAAAALLDRGPVVGPFANAQSLTSDGKATDAVESSA